MISNHLKANLRGLSLEHYTSQRKTRFTYQSILILGATTKYPPDHRFRSAWKPISVVCPSSTTPHRGIHLHDPHAQCYNQATTRSKVLNSITDNPPNHAPVHLSTEEKEHKPNDILDVGFLVQGIKMMNFQHASTDGVIEFSFIIYINKQPCYEERLSPSSAASVDVYLREERQLQEDIWMPGSLSKGSSDEVWFVGRTSVYELSRII